MTEPTRVRCKNLVFDNLLRYATQNVTRAKHLVFEIEPQLLPNGKQSQHEIIESLALALPHCHVFDAGARLGLEYVTVLQVISEFESIAREDEIVLAAQSFRRLADELMTKQSKKFDVPFGDVSHNHDYKQRGRLDWKWSYFFHGWECGFKSICGQYVDIRLEFAPEYGVLNPYFFHGYLKSTRKFMQLSKLFLNPYHDMTRTFEILHRRNKLQLLKLDYSQGYIAPNGEL